MADLGWITGSIRFVARFLRAYPLVQISTAAALWVPVSTALGYSIEKAGWLERVDSATGALGIPISGAGIAGVLGFLIVGLLQIFKRRSYRSQRKNAAAARDKRFSENATKEKLRLEQAAKADYEKQVEAFAAMSPAMRTVLRRAVEARRDTVGVGGTATELTVAARQLDDLGYVSFGHDYNGGRHSATLRPSVFKFLLANPELVGADAAKFVHRDNLKLP